jgi:hypothetical protein
MFQKIDNCFQQRTTMKMENKEPKDKIFQNKDIMVDENNTRTKTSKIGIREIKYCQEDCMMIFLLRLF